MAGGIAVWVLPVAQYPEITPPTVEVSASYPGADAQTVADTVAAPIEQQVNGVEGMMYMSSQCTNDGSYTLTVTFKLGVDLNMAQVLVQNRVALAQPVLPDLVNRNGVSVKKKSPNVLMIVNLFSPDGSRNNLYLSNYATIQLRDELARLPGVGDITYLGQRDYSMRLWLDPEKMATRNLTASDVVSPSSSRTSRSPPARSASRPSRRAGLPIHDDHARPADRRRPVRGHDSQDRPDGPHRPHARRRPRRTGRPELRPDLHAGRQAVGRAVDLPVARLQRPEDRPARPREDGGAAASVFPRGSSTPSSTTRRRSSRNRSARCSRPSATR